MDDIDDLHARFGRAETLADYARGLAALGVARFESFLFDGHSEFFGADERRVVSSPHHEPMTVADAADGDAFLEHLERHRNKKTSYAEMSAGLAASGVEKWVVDTSALTMTYCDMSGEPLLVESVESSEPQ
ncbi:MAG: DUF1398 family protein [Nocardioides sp.]